MRPTQWLVMLFGDDVGVECEILAQKAGRESRGHRFHNPDNVRISSPAAYLEDLRGAHVLADFAERRELIAARVAELAAEQQGSAIVPPSLLDEATALVEWPVPLVCSFEERPRGPAGSPDHHHAGQPEILRWTPTAQLPCSSPSPTSRARRRRTSSAVTRRWFARASPTPSSSSSRTRS